MRKLTLGLLFVFGGFGAVAVGAPNGETVSCRLTAGSGPFSSFDLRGTTIEGRWTKESGRAMPSERIEGTAFRLPEGGDAGASFQVGDWGAGRITVTSDDDGAVAFATFSSDWSTVSGYYRCRRSR